MRKTTMSKKHRFFLNSLPKSGTNLVSRAFDLAGIPYDQLGVSSALVMGSNQFIRQLARRSFLELDPLMIGLEVQMPVRRTWLNKRLGRVPEGAYITGHANWNAGLLHLLEAHDFKTIIVIRDPRDVLMSHSHYVAQSKIHFLNKTYASLGFWDRTALTLTGGRIDGLDVEPFDVMLARIDGWVSRSNATVVRFEHLVGQAGGGTDDAQEATFQTLEDVTGRHFDRALMREKLYGGSHTFRKGKVGSATDELTAEQLATVDAAIGAYREKWGYADV